MSKRIAELYQHFLKSGQKVTTDTRKLEKDSIFFALKGPNFDANLLAEQALDAGCSLAVIDDPKYNNDPNTFLVDDVLQTLQALAHHHRKMMQIPFLGITGSNGKTTTKELINVVLSKKYKVLATEGNLNNHIGVPLTLLKITTDHEFAIIEMGANHQGEIDMLCQIADPDFGIITNIGKAHLEGFGGIEGVKKGKGEMYRYIAQKKGKVFVHADDEVLREMAQANEIITYGTKKLYDVVGKMNASGEMIQMTWKTRYTASELSLAPMLQSHLVGVYNYYNLLCAACVGNYFQVRADDINDALQNYQPNNNRSQLTDTGKNKLILDYYNANPTSMRAAIENFAAMKAENKMLILGDMLELGDEAIQEHEAIIDLLKEKNLSTYALVGPIFKGIQQTNTYLSSVELRERLETRPVVGKTILIKGSRGIKLELVVSQL